MRALFLSLPAAAVAVASLGLTGLARPPRLLKPEVGKDSVWAAALGETAINKAYPERAIRDHVVGTVVLSCRAGAAGNLEACAVAAEDPSDYGFGEAALKLALSMRLKAPGKGGPPVGLVIRFPINFNSWAYRKMAPANLRPGDAAILMVELKGARPPGRSIFKCPGAGAARRYCLWSPVTWTARPGEAASQRALAKAGLDSGKALLLCEAAPDGGLTRCTVEGATSPGATEGLLELSRDFRVAPAAKDGTPVTAGRILVEINWSLLKPALAAAKP